MPPRISGGGGGLGDELLTQQTALPHSEEVEQATLGAILLDSRALDEVRGWLEPEDFYGAGHQALYAAMLELQDEEKPIDLRTVQVHLEASGRLDLVGGLAYLAGLDLALPDIDRVGHYAEIVKERSTRRSLILRCGEAIRDALDGGRTAEIVGGGLLTELDRLLTGRHKGRGFLPAADMMDALLAQIEDPREIDGARTAIPAVDRIFRAMKRKTLWLWCARPGVGKTAMLCQMAAHDIFVRGVKAGIVSLEMTGEELMIRMAAQALGINAWRVESGNLTRDEWGRIHRFGVELRRRRALFIDDEACQPVSLIGARARKLHRDHGVAALYVDYLHLMKLPGKKKVSDEVTEAADELAGLAKTLDLSLVAMGQLSRESSKAGNRRPQLHDIREGGEQPAYGVGMLHRDMDEDGEMSDEGAIGIVKHRGGNKGWTETHYDGPHLTFWSADDWRARQEKILAESKAKHFHERRR